MKLLIDANLSPRVAARLRDAGHGLLQAGPAATGPAVPST